MEKTQKIFSVGVTLKVDVIVDDHKFVFEEPKIIPFIKILPS